MSEIYKAREELPTPAPSMTQMIIDRAAHTPTREAFRAPGDGGWTSYTWKEFVDDCSDLAAGLISLGLEQEERVGLASTTNVDWIRAAFAVALAGGAVTTVYSSTGAEDAAYILNDSESKILFAEDAEQLDKAKSHRDDIPGLEKVVMFDGDGDGDFVITLDDLRKLGKEKLEADPDAVRKRADAVEPEHLATLIYTSGTTGRPKGVELLHKSWGLAGAAVEASGDVTIDEVHFLWLPLAHVFGSVLLCAQLHVGFVTAVDGRVDKIVDNLPDVKPTMMAAVPRIFEKVYAGVNDQLQKESGVKKAIADWAFKVGKRYSTIELESGRAPGGLLGFEHSIADKLVFAKIRERLGGRLNLLISGSAALARDVSEWFYIVGLPILEGYGLTETTALGTIMRPDRVRLGTVGEPIPGMEIQIADDGEILVRGDGVMRGYHNRPDANEEAFAHGDGWFSTGDIGEMDEAGCLKITDRKKDLVKTSGGKYIAPSAIESQFKAICGLAGNMVVHANGRKYASALITLDPDAAKQWAQERGKPTYVATLAEDPEMIAAVQEAVDELNENLNHWETIKKFEILDHDLTIEDGELTPSLKVKRKVVEDRYSDVLDSMYD